MGNFIRVPAPFSGALGRGAYCTLAGLDPAAVAVVTVCDAASQKVLGIKKFIGGDQADIRLSRYAVQLFDVRPVAAVDGYDGRSALAGDTHKSVSLQLESGGAMSPPAALVLSRIDSGYFKPMTDMPLSREIDRDGCDEVSLILPAGDASATARFTGLPGGGEAQAGGGATGCGERPASRCASTLAGTLSAPVEPLEIDLGAAVAPCVATLAIDMADMARRIGESGRDVVEFSAMDVTIDLGGQAEAVVLHYSLTGEAGRGVRLCWINRYGAIDYFTFVVLSRGVAVTEGTVFARTATTLTLASQYQPRATIDALAGICSSPGVWMVDEAGKYCPVEVTTHELSFPQQSPGNLKITIKR